MSEQPFVAFTIVAHNYIPRARILADSFATHHPDCAFHIVVIDHPLKVALRCLEDPRLVPITEIDFGPEGFVNMAAAYDLTEFATAVKPFALRHFLGQSDCALYLDPDIQVYAPLDPIVHATRRRHISLTPHCLQPMARDGHQPSESGIMMAGIYNLGYIGVAKGGEAFLEWWSTRLRRDAIIDPGNHLFTDQRWIDLAVPIFHPHIEQSPAYNVAYWNLDQRTLTKRAGQFYVGDEPLRFFHFSGYDHNHRHWISKHQPSSPRVLMSSSSVVAELFEAYGDLLASLTDEESTTPYGWGEAMPGLRLTGPIRRMFRDELLLADLGKGVFPPSPFAPGGATEFLRWLGEPIPSSGSQIPRYLVDLWNSRPDLRHSQHNAERGEFAGLRQWVRLSGAGEFAPLALLGWLAGDNESVAPMTDQGPPTGHGVNVVGYLTSEVGVGESARLTTGALAAAGVPVSTVDSRSTLSRQQHAFHIDGAMPYDVNVMGVNADQVAAVQQELCAANFTSRYNIGQWFWELEEFPEHFHSAFAHVNEIWAASQFIADAVAAVAPKGVVVTHMPIPLVTPQVDPTRSRAAFGLGDAFMFLYSFDMLSVLERKNPHGVVEAYRRAFGPGDHTQLVLKTMNGSFDCERLELLRWQCRDRPDIVIIDETFDRVTTNTLMNACDCYVSLHRSEGLGLTMAEAMLLEKPVIATGYSGNLDFMTDDTSHLVRWAPGKVPATARAYPAGSRWAEPDVAHAAELMRAVAADPATSAQLGRAARAAIVEQYSPERCGAAMRARLEQIWRK